MKRAPSFREPLLHRRLVRDADGVATGALEDVGQVFGHVSPLDGQDAELADTELHENRSMVLLYHHTGVAQGDRLRYRGGDYEVLSAVDANMTRVHLRCVVRLVE